MFALHVSMKQSKISTYRITGMWNESWHTQATQLLHNGLDFHMQKNHLEFSNHKFVQGKI